MEADTMKLQGMTVSGFRGFGATYHFDLSADVVLVHGPNGSGKTSLFDAILWALTGSVDRLGSSADVVSKYAEFGEGRVEVVLFSSHADAIRVVRRSPMGSTSSVVSLQVNDETFTGGSAEARLMELLWPDGATSSDPARSLTRSITRAVYLQQDQVRSFIEDEDENSRFDIVAEIVGTGRVGELVRQLELGRKAWTTTTNRDREKSLQPLTKRLAELRESVADARQHAQGNLDLELRWTEWVALVEEVGTSARRPSVPALQRQRLLSRALEELQAVVQQAENDLAALRRLEERAEKVPAPPPDQNGVRARAEMATALVGQREAELNEAREFAAIARQQMIELADAKESIAVLARLALDHLSGDCPVCGQEHDEHATSLRLHSLISDAATPAPPPPVDIADAADSLREAESAQAVAQTELARLERTEVERAAVLDEVRRAAEGLHMAGTPEEIAETCRVRIDALKEQSARASGLRQEGEALAAALAREAESQRAIDLAAEIPALEEELAILEERLNLRDAAGDDAKQLHESLRQLSEDLVGSELQVIEPLLQRIYASVDPHPSFRAVRFLTETVRGRGRLRTSLQDDGHNLIDIDPAVVLSSSQLNVLAVVTFMAMNLSATTLPLEMAALDDPLHSLDNVNLLGLADLLRRARTSRQLLLSTHDDRLAGLLERKLRPVGEQQRTTVLRFDSWEPAGPTITVRDVERDTGVQRLRSVS